MSCLSVTLTIYCLWLLPHPAFPCLIVGVSPSENCPIRGAPSYNSGAGGLQGNAGKHVQHKQQDAARGYTFPLSLNMRVVPVHVCVVMRVVKGNGIVYQLHFIR